MFTFIRQRIFALIDSLGREYTAYKYGPKAILCTITSKNNKIYANLGIGEPTEWDISPDVCLPIRKQCGEYVLVRHGVPQPDEDPPIVVLLPTVSLLSTLGCNDFFQFIGDWSGDSKVGDIVVVKYKIM